MASHIFAAAAQFDPHARLPTPITPRGKRLPMSVLRLYAAAVTVLATVTVAPAASADGGCIPDDIAGQVPRLTRPSDNVCVAPNIA
jgi:hypothetical protein